MRYVMSKYEEHVDNLTYRFFIADNLYYFTEGKRTRLSYSEMRKKLYEPVDTRTGDEIAKDVINRLGLRFKE